MKSRLCFLLLLAACSLYASAQTETGTFLVGGNLQLNTAKNNTNVTVSPSVGYFFVDNFAAGALFNFGYSKSGEAIVTKTTNFSVGPFVRYYVGTTNIRPFLQGDIEFRTTKYKFGSEESSTSTGTDFFVGPGAALFLNRNVALEGLAGYAHTANKNQNGSGGFAFKVGFQIYLTRGDMRTATNATNPQ